MLNLEHDEEIDNLMIILQEDIPESSQTHNWIRVQREWKKKQPEIKINILCPYGDWKHKSVFAFCENVELSGHVFGVAYCSNDKEEIFKEAIIKSNNIPWNKISRIRGVLPRIVNILKPIIIEKCGIIPVCVPLQMYHMKAEDAANVKDPPISENVRIKNLKEDDLQLICNTWTHFTDNYRPVVQAMINYNLSSAIILDNKLVSWTMEVEYGGIGMTYTLPEYRKKGLATLAYTQLTRKMGKIGISPFLYVFKDNHCSIRQVEKIGYKYLITTNTIVIANDVQVNINQQLSS